MLNIIILYDDLDGHIGDNFTLSYNNLSRDVNLAQYNTIELNDINCSRDNLEVAITNLYESSFIFIGYSHGESDKLISSHSPDGYLTFANSYFFSKSLVYADTCHSGLELKDSLINNGCFAYIGYNDELLLPDNPNDESLFIDCQNKGIVHFLTTDDTLEDAFNAMKIVYNDTVDFLSQKDVLLASRLRKNSARLVIAGNKTLTRNDFFIR